MNSNDLARNATRKVARHAATLRYEALPPALVELTNQCVLDTLGVSIGASTLAAGGRIIREYVGEMGGRPESTMLGFGGKRCGPVATPVGNLCGRARSSHCRERTGERHRHGGAARRATAERVLALSRGRRQPGGAFGVIAMDLAAQAARLSAFFSSPGVSLERFR
jgi:hypothetical protein